MFGPRMIEYGYNRYKDNFYRNAASGITPSNAAEFKGVRMGVGLAGAGLLAAGAYGSYQSLSQGDNVGIKDFALSVGGAALGLGSVAAPYMGGIYEKVSYNRDERSRLSRIKDERYDIDRDTTIRPSERAGLNAILDEDEAAVKAGRNQRRQGIS